MKPVLHIITTLERGGAENQLLILVAAQIRSGRKVIVVPLKGKPELVEKFRELGAQVLTKWMNKWPVQQILGIRRTFRNQRPIVHSHLPRSELLSVFVSQRDNLIVSRHNAEAFFPGAPSWLSVVLSRFVTFGNTRVIAITEAVKDFLVVSGEVASDKVVDVVEYGFPEHKRVEKYDDEQYLISQLGISDSEIVIGTIGRLAHQKDYPTLIKGFAKFVSFGHESKLIILGEGALREELVALSVNLGIEDKIIWLAKQEDVFRYLRLMDVFVLASRYEGFGLVLLEAMSMDLPIVAARNLAVEQVLGSNYPWLFEIASVDEMATQIAAIMHGGNRASSILHGNQRLAYFSVSRMLGKMEILYEELSAVQRR